MKPFDDRQRFLTRSPLDEQQLLSGQFWEEARVFLALAKTGSFSAAANLLKMSHQTVNRKVRRLQDQLNSQLLVSTRNGTGLTTEGKELALKLAALDYQFFSIANSFKAPNQELEGSVRISVTEGLAGVFLASALPRFKKQYPKIRLHIKIPINVNSLKLSQTDIMIGFQKVDDPDIICTPMGYLHLVPIVSRKYIDSHGIPISENIKSHEFIDSEFYAAKSGMWDSWQNLVSRGSSVDYIDSSLAYGMAVREGAGIGLLGNYVLSDPIFVALDLGIHVCVPMYALGLIERLQAKAVDAAFFWVESIFGDSAPWFGHELALEETKKSELGEAIRGIFSRGARDE